MRTLILALCLSIFARCADCAVSFAQTTVSLCADNPYATITVRRDTTTASQVIVDLATNDEHNVQSYVDYTPLNGSVTLGKYQMSSEVRLPLVNGSDRTSTGIVAVEIRRVHGDSLCPPTSIAVELTPPKTQWSIDFADTIGKALEQPIREITTYTEFLSSRPFFNAAFNQRAYTPGDGTYQPRYAANATDAVVVDGVSLFKWTGDDNVKTHIQSRGGELFASLAWTPVQSKIPLLLTLNHGLSQHDADCYMSDGLFNGQCTTTPLTLRRNWYYCMFAQQNTNVTTATTPVRIAMAEPLTTMQYMLAFETTSTAMQRGAAVTGVAAGVRRWWIEITPSDSSGNVRAGAAWNNIPIDNMESQMVSVGKISPYTTGTLAPKTLWNFGGPDGYYVVRLAGETTSGIHALNTSAPLAMNIANQIFPDDVSPNQVQLWNIASSVQGAPTYQYNQIQALGVQDPIFVSDARTKTNSVIFAWNSDAKAIPYTAFAVFDGVGFSLARPSAIAIDKPQRINYKMIWR